MCFKARIISFLRRIWSRDWHAFFITVVWRKISDANCMLHRIQASINRIIWRGKWLSGFDFWQVSPRRDWFFFCAQCLLSKMYVVLRNTEFYSHHFLLLHDEVFTKSDKFSTQKLIFRFCVEKILRSKLHVPINEVVTKILRYGIYKTSSQFKFPHK